MLNTFFSRCFSTLSCHFNPVFYSYYTSLKWIVLISSNSVSLILPIFWVPRFLSLYFELLLIFFPFFFSLFLVKENFRVFFTQNDEILTPNEPNLEAIFFLHRQSYPALCSVTKMWHMILLLIFISFFKPLF